VADAAVQVLIVGAGPTGLVLANILGMYGIRALIAERNAATVGEPRAVSIDDESLRTMQFLGIVDAVKARIVAGYGSYYHSPRGAVFARVVPQIVEFGHPRRSAFRQPVLEAQLREALGRFACVKTRFSTRVGSLAEEGEGVRAELVDEDGNATTVRADYAVACDGARSGIREALGIGMQGSTYEQRWLIVDLAGSTDRFRHTKVYCDPARPALALPGPDGTRRYEFMLLPGEDPEALLDETRVRALLARHSDEDAHLEIVRKVVYQFHARIADRWRAGRIFLAGDAAHLSPPFAGQGMNSGVRDAQNLGWKLAYVLLGRLPASALDSYESERRPHAWSLIQMAVRMGKVMMPTSALNALAVQTAIRVLSLYPPARDWFMQMKYKPKPYYREGLVAGDAGEALRGRMLPQPLLERPDGQQVRLDDLIGPAFAVIEWDDGGCELEPPAAERPLGAKSIRVIPADHRFARAALPHETLARDAQNVLGPLFAATQVAGVILRPDRYVAACLPRGAAPAEADRLLALLARPPSTR
jgi:3-(3-hydroxy-phenyl)propionate hydroxylase